MPPTYAISHVSGKYPTSSAFLSAGAMTAVRFGFQGLKLFMSEDYQLNYPNQVFGSVPTSLVELAQTAPFVEAFQTAEITHYYLNCWTFANTVNNIWTTTGNADFTGEYDEIYDLAVHLRNTYPTKKFILQCWEGDWSLLGSFNQGSSAPHDRHQRMVSFYKTWRSAINDALRVTTGGAEVSFAIEVNRSMDPSIDRLWWRILPEIQPDAVSFSAYEAINTWGANQAQAEVYVDQLIRRMVFKVRQSMPGTRMYFGEFGWPLEEPSFTSLGLDGAALLQVVIDVCNSINITDLIYWELFDNEHISPGNPRGYYVLKPDGSYASVGTKWLQLNGAAIYDSFTAPAITSNLQLVAKDFTNTTWVDREGNFNATENGSISDGTVSIATSHREVYGFSAANYFALPANAAFETTTTTNRTWDFIVRADDGILLGRYNAPYGGAVELAIVGGLATAVIYDDTGLGAYRYIVSNASLTTGNYYKLTFVLDSSNNKIQIYINGELDNEVSGTTGTITPGAAVQYFLGNSNGNNYPFAGRIVEATFYTTALTALDIYNDSGMFNAYRGY